MDKREIVVFDFNGTLTTKDTLLEFIKFSHGKFSFYMGLLLNSPILIAYKLKIYPNWKAKQALFTYFFHGISYSEFQMLCVDFASKIEYIKNPIQIEKLNAYLRNGAKVYVISASIEEWIKPWCQKYGVQNVLGTKIEIDLSGKLTGNFSSKNCYGQEKVNRLLEKEPDRTNYILYAYGDSAGDKEIIEFADYGYYIK